MIENFFIIVLLVAACSATPYHACHANEDYTVPSIQIEPRPFTQPECDRSNPFDMNVNWRGVLAGIASMVPPGMIPGINFIPGILTIFSSFDFAGMYDDAFMPSLQECVAAMIGKAMEQKDFKLCVLRLEQIEIKKKKFLNRLEEIPTSHNVSGLIDAAWRDITAIGVNVEAIAADFALGGEYQDTNITYDRHHGGDDPPTPTDDRHHERFLDLLLEGLAVELSSQALLVSTLSNINYPSVCSEVINVRINLQSARDTYFENKNKKSSFNMQDVLDRAPISDWTKSIKWKHTFARNDVAVHDDYRGFDVEGCCFHPVEYIKQCCYSTGRSEHNPVTNACYLFNYRTEWDCNPSYLHPDDSTANCKYALDYANTQLQIKKKSISDGNKLITDLMAVLDIIEELHNCF